MNYYTLYQNKKMAKHQVAWLTKGHGLKKPTDCIKCGKCEEACPQHIKIREELDNVVVTLLSK